MRHKTGFSVICRLMALILFGQSVLTSLAWAQQGAEAGEAKRKASWNSAPQVQEMPPVQAKGVPRMKLDSQILRGHSSNGLNRSDKANKPDRTHRIQTDKASTTLLNEVGRLDQKIPQETLRAWKKELGSSKASNERKAWLTLWLGENELASKEPRKAIVWFSRAWGLVSKKSPVYGLAKYNHALARFYAGMYEKSAHELEELLGSQLTGYDFRNASLWLRHARVCAGYHEEHAKLGITQPESLDPLCGVTSIAICLKALGKRYDKEYVSARVHYTGEGSSMRDLEDACAKFGLVGHGLSTNDKGLKLLPKPIITRVEHDHFVTVVKADEKGVTYMCSDCGPYPGGQRTVTWKQWRAMEADAYLAVVEPGSKWDKAFSLLRKGKQERGAPTRSAKDRAERPAPDFNFPTPLDVTAFHQNLELATDGVEVDPASWIDRSFLFEQAPLGVQALEQPSIQEIPGIDPELTQHVVAFLNLEAIVCGFSPEALKCLYECCPMVGGAGGMGGPGFGGGLGLGGTGGGMGPGRKGPSAGDPVNAATGEEEYKPEPDLVVYNPIGPSVIWRRTYNSLSNRSSLYTGFFTLGHGWSHPYNIRVDASGGVPHSIIFENGAKVSLNLPSQPTAQDPIKEVPMPAGYPVKLTWHFDSIGVTHFEMMFRDRSKLVTPPSTFGADEAIVYFSKQVDRNGNFIQAVHEPITKQLLRIEDSKGLPLISFDYDVNNNMIAANDRYNRSVYYRVSRYDHSPPGRFYYELDQVSQVVPTGTPDPPLRYEYGYRNYTNREPGYFVPYLHTISVPSPTGTGMSTATINYYETGPNAAFVQNLTDANGNLVELSDISLNETKVTVKNPQKEVIYEYSVVFTPNMTTSAIKNAQGVTVASYAYADPDNPIEPSSITDGNNRTTYFDWDQYGNLLSLTTNKGTTTYYGYSYDDFALGQLDWVQQGTKTPTYFTYYQPSGLVETISTPIPGEAGTGNVQTTTYTYDSLGNVLTVARPGNNAASTRTMTFNYTTDGGYSQPAAIGQPLTMTDELSHVWHFRYDSRGNLTRSWDPLGNSDTDFEYNLANQRTITRLQATGNTGPGRAYSQSTYLYPAGPATQVNNYNESGALVRTLNFTYGLEGEMLSRTGTQENVSQTFDAAYRKKTTVNGRNFAINYSYDTVGNLASITYPGGGNDRYQFPSYDPVGNPLQRVDGNGIVTNFLYNDEDGLLSDIQYPASPSLNVHTNYDAYGRVLSSTDSVGSASCTYDDLDNELSETQTYTGLASKTLSYQYYPDGSRQQLNLAGSGLMNYLYDATGRLLTMTHPLGTTSWDYFDNNWTGRRTHNGIAYTDFLFNPVGAPSRVTSKNSTGTMTHSDYNSFSYDGVFNLKGFTASVPATPTYSGTVNYNYDAKYRMNQETSTRLGGYTHNFVYDDAGNPTTWKGVSQSFNSNDQFNTAGFVYDNNGNPTTYRGVNCTFDPENRLTGYGTLLTAGYRGDGLRGWKQTSSGRTYFLYDVDGHPVIEMNSAGAVTALNIFAPDGLVARRQGATDIHYTFDHQGNVANRLNNTGALFSSSTFDAYGAETRTSEQNDPWAYNGKSGYYKDIETGLYRCAFRDYDPAAGRWLNRDPAGVNGGVNQYGYCKNDPVLQTDPSGLAGIGIEFAHMYIFFKKPCDGHYGYGFWPGWLPWGPGKIMPEYRRGCWSYIQNDDPIFEWALCECIKFSKRFPHMYWFPHYTCVQWVQQMWACATALATAMHVTSTVLPIALP